MLRDIQEKIEEIKKIEDPENIDERIPIRTTRDLNAEVARNDVPERIEENQKSTAIYSKKILYIQLNSFI